MKEPTLLLIAFCDFGVFNMGNPTALSGADQDSTVMEQVPFMFACLE